MVVVLALVAGLLFFMTRAPETPTGVRATDLTATSVLIGWSPSTGGRSIDKYLILRDGTQVGSVSGSSSTYLDKGLSPGSEHRYGVVASSGSRRSDPSVALVTSTVAPSPVRLTAISSTITTLWFRWSPPPDTPTPDQYVILRDGNEIESVPGTATSYSDSGHDPGTTFRYQVAAEWAGAQSTPSVALVTSTVAPSPVRLTAASSTITTLAFRWSPPPASPTPDQYVILRDGNEIESIPGTATSYRDSGLDPVTTFRYRVAAEWAGARSEPTTELVMKTGTPTLASARLAGSWPVNVKAVRTPGGSVKAGSTWTTTWQFVPKCKTGPCAVVVAGDPMGSNFTPHSFKATLARNGTLYTGTTKAHITHCGTGPVAVDISNTITLTIRLKGAAMDGKSWAADSWAGTMVLSSPYTSTGRYYCPAQSISTTISGSD